MSDSVVYSIIIAAIYFTVHVSPCLPTSLPALTFCHNCLQWYLRYQFQSFFIVTLSPSSSCHYHGFPSYATTFHRFYTAISPCFCLSFTPTATYCQVFYRYCCSR